MCSHSLADRACREAPGSARRIARKPVRPGSSGTLRYSEYTLKQSRSALWLSLETHRKVDSKARRLQPLKAASHILGREYLPSFREYPFDGTGAGRRGPNGNPGNQFIVAFEVMQIDAE